MVAMLPNIAASPTISNRLNCAVGSKAHHSQWTRTLWGRGPTSLYAVDQAHRKCPTTAMVNANSHTPMRRLKVSDMGAPGDASRPPRCWDPAPPGGPPPGAALPADSTDVPASRVAPSFVNSRASPLETVDAPGGVGGAAAAVGSSRGIPSPTDRCEFVDVVTTTPVR